MSWQEKKGFYFWIIWRELNAVKHFSTLGFPCRAQLPRRAGERQRLELRTTGAQSDLFAALAHEANRTNYPPGGWAFPHSRLMSAHTHLSSIWYDTVC